MPKKRERKRPVPPLDPSAAMYDEDHAAVYVGYSAAWLRARRAEYVRAEKEGRTDELKRLPKHRVMGKSIRYLRVDLDTYIAENAVAGGTVAYSNRGRVSGG